MLIKYHDELKIIIDGMEPKYFSNFKKDLNFINMEMLMKGLHYPDVPCGKLIRSENSDKSIKWIEHTPCKNIFPLAYLFLDNMNSSIGLKEIVNSHRGRQAIGHSMTPDPKYKMIDIQQKILRRLEILYMLALNDTSLLQKCKNKDCKACYTIKNKLSKDDKFECVQPQPNIFWIGLIIHCIEDSYSRAHTLREYTDNNLKHHNKCLGVPNTPDDEMTGGGKDNTLTNKEEHNISAYIIRLIGDSIETLEESNTEVNIINIVTVIEKIIKKKILDDNNKNIKDEKSIVDNIKNIIKKNPNDVDHLIKLIQFFKQNKMEIKKKFKGEENLPSSQILKEEHILSVKNENGFISDPKTYPYIISFRYVPHQANCGKKFHMDYDKKKPTCESNLEFYKRQNIIDVLNIYKEHVNKYEPNKITEYITEFIKYVANNVFYIKTQYQINPSAIKCNIIEKCECELEKKNVYDLHNMMIKKYNDPGTTNDERNKMLYQKYQKYKMKYIKLKANDNNF